MAHPNISLKLDDYLDKGGLHTASSLADAGFNRMLLARATSAGRVIQYARGIYCSPSALDEEGISLAALTLLNPGAVVCLLSAAQVHRLSDEDPRSVWLAVDRHDRKAMTASNLPAKTVWWQPSYFDDGIQTIKMAGVDVRVTDPARTVVDLVRNRGKLGDEPAMKALQDYLTQGRPTSDLWDRAKAIGFLEDIEPFYRLSDALREDIPTRGP